METVTLDAGTELYRLHWAENGPIYFDAGGGGRFNPVGAPGNGACYLALDPLAAFVEVIRTRFVLRSDLGERRLTVGRLARSVVLFDASARPNRFDEHVPTTAALASGDHRESQAAASLLVSHVDGLRYKVRHDPAGELVGVALFNDAGEAPVSSVLADAKTIEVPDELVGRAVDEFKYRVVLNEPRLPNI